jgi:hypothetical protein
MYLKDVALSGHNMSWGTPTNLFRSSDMPADDKLLTRYISADLFARMSVNGLNFSRFDNFMDTYDGSRPPFEFSNIKNPKDVEQLKKESEVQKRYSSVSCWTMNEEVSEKMFVLMETNGGGRREVAIRTTISRACAALNWSDKVGGGESDWKLRGPVLYVDSLDFDVLQMGRLRSFFWKHCYSGRGAAEIMEA